MIKDRIRIIYSYINIVRVLPLYLLLLLSKNKSIIIEDINKNFIDRTTFSNKNSNNYSLFFKFTYLMSNYKEFRNVFYYRLGIISNLISWICPKLKPLYITSNHIGKGFILFHGFSTIIYANSIGDNCTIYHNVTIGKTNDIPSIGNNVTICTGSIIIGGIRIGNNVTIGAGSLVNKDIPDNSVVIGNPCRILQKQKG